MEQPVANIDAAVQPATKPKVTRTRKPKVANVAADAASTAANTTDVSVAEQPQAPVAETAAKVPRKKPVKVEKVAPFDFVGHAAQRYTEGGWTVFKHQPGSVNDFVAHRDKKLHHVRVVPVNIADDAKFSGEQKNAFIQNAFSNAAVPVFARVKPVSKKGDTVPTAAAVTFENINDGARVIVGAAKK